MLIDNRFWALVKTDLAPGKCWLWQGVKVGGYGRVHRKGKLHMAHRYIYEAEVGPVPDGMNVLHHCDIPTCVRPAHLWLGTHKENMEDMAAKGRAPRKFGDQHWTHQHPEKVPRGETWHKPGRLRNHVKGEQVANSILTEDKVREIRSRYGNGGLQTEIAKDLGVSQATVSRVLRGNSWAHVV